MFRKTKPAVVFDMTEARVVEHVIPCYTCRGSGLESASSYREHEETNGLRVGSMSVEERDCRMCRGTGLVRIRTRLLDIPLMTRFPTLKNREETP